MPFTHRSEASRTAILTAARRLLAERGYEGATIRAVAAEAGIDPSMVMRYYGNKDGLFAAAVDLELRMPDPAGWPRAEVGARLARHIVDRWEGAIADELIIMLLRSVGTNKAAAESLRTVLDRQVAAFVERLDGERPQARRRAGLLASQVLGIALGRYVLELDGVVAMDGDALAATLAPVLQHYLFGEL